MLTINPNNTAPPLLHSYLAGCVGPRPIAFASTISADGKPNLSPFSFFNLFSGSPPVLVFSPARRGRDNATKDTYDNVKAVPEVVINVVNHALVEQASLSSGEYAPGVSEFEKAGLTPLPSEAVKPFRVKESPVQMECRVRDIIGLGDRAGAGNLVICDVILLHISEDVLDANGRVDPDKIDLVGRMGGNWYCRASGPALFEVAKPAAAPGIGVDSIPEPVRNSTVLTGNDLGRLGSVEKLPGMNEVVRYRQTTEADTFFRKHRGADLAGQTQRRARQLISENKVDQAWLLLLAWLHDSNDTDNTNFQL